MTFSRSTMAKQASNLHLICKDYFTTFKKVPSYFLKHFFFILALFFFKVGIGVAANIDGCCTKNCLVTWDKGIIATDSHRPFDPLILGWDIKPVNIKSVRQTPGSLITPTAIYGWAEPSSSDAPLSVLLRHKQGLHAMISSLWSPPFCLLHSRKNEPVSGMPVCGLKSGLSACLLAEVPKGHVTCVYHNSNWQTNHPSSKVQVLFWQTLLCSNQYLMDIRDNNRFCAAKDRKPIVNLVNPFLTVANGQTHN